MPSRIRAAALVAVLVGAIVVAKEPAGPAIYDPDPTGPDAGKLEGETWSKQSETASIWLTRIDEATRTGYIHRRAGLETDPFMATPGRTGGGFIAFHVLIENTSERRLVFQPQSCRLQTNLRDFQEPMDLPTIWTAYHMADREPPAGIERIRGAILDGEVVLEPGQKRDGLLVYRAIDTHAKTYQIDVGATLTRGERLGFFAHYKKRKV